MMSVSWQYDEMLHSGVNFSDLAEVEAYDGYMQKLRDIKPEVEKIKQAICLGPGDVIIDIGAGTGELAIELSLCCKKVVAIDISPAMLHYAEKKAKLRGANNISFQHAGFLTCQYPREAFAAVISQFALHHLPDFWKLMALKRVYDMLKLGGRLYLQDTVLPSAVDDYNLFLADAINRIEVAGGEKVARDAERTIKDEYPTLDWILEGLLKNAGFSTVQVEYNAPFIGAYICTK